MEIILNTIIITYNIIMYLDPRKKIQIIIITYKINTPITLKLKHINVTVVIIQYSLSRIIIIVKSLKNIVYAKIIKSQ